MVVPSKGRRNDLTCARGWWLWIHRLTSLWIHGHFDSSTGLLRWMNGPFKAFWMTWGSPPHTRPPDWEDVHRLEDGRITVRRASTQVLFSKILWRVKECLAQEECNMKNSVRETPHHQWVGRFSEPSTGEGLRCSYTWVKAGLAR